MVVFFSAFMHKIKQIFALKLSLAYIVDKFNKKLSLISNFY